VLKFVGGHEYRGNVDNGVMSGRGEYVWVNGTSYTGTFSHNQVMRDVPALVSL
jgi:hypothetical protein